MSEKNLLVRFEIDILETTLFSAAWLFWHFYDLAGSLPSSRSGRKAGFWELLQVKEVGVTTLVWCLTKFMLTTKMHFYTSIILGKMHCSRNFILIGVVLKQILINQMHDNTFLNWCFNFFQLIDKDFLCKIDTVL